MEVNSIRAAIQIDNYEACETSWKESDFCDGTTDFYTFMTAPTPAREAFIKSMDLTYGFMGTVVISKI